AESDLRVLRVHARPRGAETLLGREPRVLDESPGEDRLDDADRAPDEDPRDVGGPLVVGGRDLVPAGPRRRAEHGGQLHLRAADSQGLELLAEEALDLGGRLPALGAPLERGPQALVQGEPDRRRRRGRWRGRRGGGGGVGAGEGGAPPAPWASATPA